MGRIKRSVESKSAKPLIEARLKQAFEGWMEVLLPSCTETEAIQRLDKFATLREFFVQDHIGHLFAEKGFAKDLSESIERTNEVDTLICLLFTVSDLIDIDNTCNLGIWFCSNGFIDTVMRIIRRPETTQTASNTNSVVASPARDTSRLKASCICALSSLSSIDIDGVAQAMDRREIDQLNNILQLKSMMSLHSRCIIFINNLYISNYFEDQISRQIIPAVMTLLMYNVTNHIKLIKKRIQENLSRAQQQQSSVVIEHKTKEDSNQSQSGNQETPTSDQAVSKSEQTNESSDNQAPAANASNLHDQVDKMYNDSLYIDFIASACVLLGNLTTSIDNCKVAETYSIIDIMTLLFHNSNDHHTPEILTNVVKCLANLANLESNRAKLMKSNILSMAIRLLLTGRLTLELRAHLVLLLANMCGYEGANSIIIDHSVILAFVALLDETSGSPVPSLAPQSTSSNGVPNFGLSGVKNEDFQRFACLAIANLAIDLDSVPLMLRAGCLERMVALCYSDSPFIQRQAVRTLNSFAGFPGGAYSQEMKDAGAEHALSHVIETAPPMVVSHLSKQHSLPTAEHLASSALAYLKGARSNQQTSNSTANQATKPSRTNQTPVPTSTESIPSSSKTSTPPVSNSVLIKQAEEEKNKGNDFFKSKLWTESIVCYSKAIELTPTNETLYSNRSAAYSQLGDFENALKDAEKCIALAKDWVKGHFRRGKALMGLQQYSAAIFSLKEALNCDRGSKEIQEALRFAVARAKEMEIMNVAAQFGHLNGQAIMNLLQEIFSRPSTVSIPITMVSKSGSIKPEATAGIGLQHVTQLLVHLLDLLKKWYDPELPKEMKKNLLGDTNPDDLGMDLHTWAAHLDVKTLMEAKGMDYLLFHLDLVSPCIKRAAIADPGNENLWPDSQDLSCYQFGFFVTTILTRLVLEGHNNYGLTALKRLIQLNSDRQVRISIGTPLTQSVMQITGQGCWGLPKMPWLRQLFLANSGVRCIAMDSFEGMSYDKSCIDFLHSLTISEWLSLPQSQIDSVIEWTILPAFNDGERDKNQQKIMEIWATLFSIGGTRQNLPHYLKFKESSFIEFVIEESRKAQLPPIQVDPAGLQAVSKEAKALGMALAHRWLSS